MTFLNFKTHFIRRKAYYPGKIKVFEASVTLNSSKPFESYSTYIYNQKKVVIRLVILNGNVKFLVLLGFYA